jgi:hypothetical protein
MKKRRLIIVLAFVVFVALGTVACIMVLNVLREERLATIELPSGDKIIIKYCICLAGQSAFLAMKRLFDCVKKAN